MQTTTFVTLAYLLIVVMSAYPQTTSRGSNLTSNPVYEKHCAKCHGKTAEGRHFGGPSLLSEKAIGMSADDLRALITNGKGRMPKFKSKLTSDEIDTLVQQIKAPTSPK